jgi:mono/diheme cytochrome c family protein
MDNMKSHISISLSLIFMVSAVFTPAIPSLYQVKPTDQAPEIPTATPPHGMPIEPDMPLIQDRLAPPPTVYPPTQADQGAQVFYLVCMACHGDRGQGLTDEWRGALDLEDQNCWQSKCHASNHPPDGFVFPHLVPPVIGEGIINKYQTALGLHNFIQASMPWQAPGSLSAEKYWQLTAFLVRANGIDPGETPLDEQNAGQLHFQTLSTATPVPTPTPAPLVRFTKGGLPLLLAGSLFIVVIIALVFVKMNFFPKQQV